MNKKLIPTDFRAKEASFKGLNKTTILRALKNLSSSPLLQAVTPLLQVSYSKAQMSSSIGQLELLTIS